VTGIIDRRVQAGDNRGDAWGCDELDRRAI
jgi:hypothetical protein